MVLVVNRALSFANMQDFCPWKSMQKRGVSDLFVHEGQVGVQTLYGALTEGIAWGDNG